MKAVVTSNINIPKTLKKFDDDSFGKFTAQTWWKLFVPYVPYDSGNLSKNVSFSTPWQIRHTMKYAGYVYNSNNKFRTMKNAKATKEWDKVAIKDGKDKKLIAIMQKYVDDGRLNLDK